MTRTERLSACAEVAELAKAATPGPWEYDAGGGHAPNAIRGSESVQITGWPQRRNGWSNAGYSERICERLGDPELPAPAANIRLITSIHRMAALCAEIPGLEERIAELERDAARYRWLRDNARHSVEFADTEDGVRGLCLSQIPSALDAAIDQAMLKEKGHD